MDSRQSGFSGFVSGWFSQGHACVSSFSLPQLAQGNISMDHPSPRVHPEDDMTGTSLAQILLVYYVHEGWEGGEGP